MGGAPAEAIRMIFPMMNVMIRRLFGNENIHFASSAKDRTRMKLQAGKFMGKYVDKNKLLNCNSGNLNGKTDKHGNPLDKKDKALIYERDYFTFLLENVYGACRLADHDLVVRGGLFRKEENSENWRLNMDFFEARDLDVEKLKIALRRCFDNPEAVFPAWIKDAGFGEALWLYDYATRDANGELWVDWSRVKATDAKPEDYELPEALPAAAAAAAPAAPPARRRCRKRKREGKEDADDHTVAILPADQVEGGDEVSSQPLRDNDLDPIEPPAAMAEAAEAAAAPAPPPVLVPARAPAGAPSRGAIDPDPIDLAVQLVEMHKFLTSCDVSGIVNCLRRVLPEHGIHRLEETAEHMTMMYALEPSRPGGPDPIVDREEWMEYVDWRRFTVDP